MIAAIAATLALTLPATAGAHGTGPTAAMDHGKELELLHKLAKREERKWKAMTPAERRARAHRVERKAKRLAAATEGDPAEVGQWTQAPFNLPNYAVHAAMLPTGKILFWGIPFFNDFTNRGEASLWDPALGYGPAAFTDVDPPLVDPDGPQGPQGMVPAPIYCAGQSFLPSGELLVTGGNLAYTWKDSRYSSPGGTPFAFTFDPWTERWTQQPSMNQGRWYPSQLELGDGTTLLVGGYSDRIPGGINNSDIEVFVPPAVRGGIGTIGRYGSAQRETNLYPHLATLPNGDALLAGPGDMDSAILPMSQLGQGPLAWQQLGKTSGYRIGGSAVMSPVQRDGSWKVTQLGGYGTIPEANGLSAASADAETLDGSNLGGGWQSDGTLQLGRSFQNTVLLPDESMVTIGGGIGFTATNGNWSIDPSGERRRVEVFDPATRTWKLGPAQLEDRSYHSVALLMPDGRVWSAGDDRYPLASDGMKSRSETAEIYSPPYLFRGPRPAFDTAPTAAKYNHEIPVTMSGSGAAAQKFVLIAPGATTHGADMQQRVVPLRVDGQVGNAFTLRAPLRSEMAPPGNYMLFALSDTGVPAVARWIRLSY
jgi:hypothetical protein